MVSQSAHLSSFFNSMPQGVKRISELRKKKEQYDLEALRFSTLTTASARMLSQIIGEDKFYRSAGKSSKESLRHYIFNIKKSFEKFIHASPKIEAISKEVVYGSTLILIKDSTFILLKEFLETLKELDKIWAHQAQWIKENKKAVPADWREYLAFVEDEKLLYLRHKDLVKEFVETYQDLEACQKNEKNAQVLEYALTLLVSLSAIILGVALIAESGLKGITDISLGILTIGTVTYGIISLENIKLGMHVTESMSYLKWVMKT